MSLRPGIAETHQAADGSRSGVKDGDAVMLDHLPPAVGVGMVGRTLVHEAGGAQDQRRIDNVAVAGDPARIGRAPPAILFLDVEDPLQGGAGVDLIAAMRVQQSLWLAGSAGRVKDEQRILGIHHFGWAGGRGDRQRHQVVIPVVAACLHGHVLAGAPDDDDVFHHGRAMDRLVGHAFQIHGLAAQPRAVGGDQHAALGVLDAISQRLLAEAAVDHRMHRADLGAGQHGNRQLGDTPHVDGNAVTLAHPHAAQDVGEAVDLLPQTEVGEGYLVARFSLPDQSQFVLAPGSDVTIEGVERDVGLAAGKPFVERCV